MSNIKEGLGIGLSELCVRSRVGNGTTPPHIKQWANELSGEIISYLKSQNWKSPEDCKKCLKGFDVAMKPPIKKRGFVVYEGDPMYEAILARRDLDSRKLQ